MSVDDAIEGAEDRVGRIDEAEKSESSLASKLEAFVENPDEEEMTFEYGGDAG